MRELIASAILLCLFLLPVPAHAGEALIAAAQRDLGKTGPQLGLPARLWCGRFMERVARKVGAPIPKNPASARAWATVGKKLSVPHRGAVVVFARGKNGGHVGIVKDVHGSTITVISGNHNRRVAVATYPTRRAIAFRSLSPAQRFVTFAEARQ